MPRLTITLPQDLDFAVRQHAAHLGVPVATIARRALTDYLNQPNLISIAGLGASGHTDTAQRVEEILRDEWDSPTRSRS